MKQNLFKLLNCEEDPLFASNTFLQAILLQPELLVGQRIKHRFDENGELVWYEGRVLRMNADTKEFEVIYDGEEDSCWFLLLEDISAGDLLIV